MPHTSLLRRVARLGVATASLLGAQACSKPAATEAAAASGAGVKDVPINLAIGDGGGSVDPASAKSDEKGEIKAKWILGPGQVAQSLIASAPGTTPDTLMATGILPNAIVVVQGNAQSARVGGDQCPGRSDGEVDDGRRRRPEHGSGEREHDHAGIAHGERDAVAAAAGSRS